MSTPSASSTDREAPPLPVGLTLDRGFALLRRHPRPLLLPQLLLNLVPLVVGLVLVLLGALLLGDVETRTETVRQSTFLGDSELVQREVWQLTDGQTATVIVLGVIAAVVFAWFLTAAYVSVVRAADRVIEGQEALPVRPAMRDALRATPRLFGLAVVYGLLATAAVAVAALVVVLVAAAAGALAVLVGLAAFLALAWAGVRLFPWPFVHLSEGAGLQSFGRAWELTRGRFWALVGVLLLVTIVVSVVYAVLSVGLELLLGAATSLSDAAGIVALVPYVLLSVAFGLVFTAAFISPLAVAYRTLAGRDTADLWEAAQLMAPGSVPAPATDPGVRRWDASEPPIASADGAPSEAPTGDDARGPADAADAERRWGRGDERSGG